MNNLKISPDGIALIKRFEGCKYERYICPAGKPTIGYGHVILKDEDIPDIITPQEAEDLLRKDLARFEKVVNTVEKPLTQYQFDALISFAFNVGTYAFKASTMCMLLNEGKYNYATQEFGVWIFANKQPLPGLIKRRAAEALLFINHKE